MNSQIDLRRMAIVITGENHNPSILNPDFLNYNGIVKGEIKDTLTTPLVSYCTFSNGFRINSEQNRVSFILDSVTDSAQLALCHDAAKNYLQKVPHVHYAGVGVNFKRVFSGNNLLSPLNMLSDRAKTPFDSTPPSAAVTLAYNFPDRKVNIKVVEEVLSSSKSPESKIVMSGNFHYDIRESEGGDSYRVAIGILSSWENDLSCFKNLTSHILKSMEDQ